MPGGGILRIESILKDQPVENDTANPRLVPAAVETPTHQKEERFMKRNLLASVIVLAFVLSLCACQTLPREMTAKEYMAEARETIVEVPLPEAKAIFERGDYIFLDCRTETEFNAGHIPKAVNLQRGLLEFYMGKKVTTDKNAKIMVYCKTGGRGSLATKTLMEMGYKNAVNMGGGWTAWKEAGYPVE